MTEPEPTIAEAASAAAPLAEVADDARALTATPKLRSRKDGAAIRLDDLDRKLLNLMQGSFTIAQRPYEHVASRAEVSEQHLMARVQHLLDKRIIRQITPIFDTRAL